MVLVYTNDFSKIPYKNKVFSQFHDKLTLVANGNFISLSELESKGKRTFSNNDNSVFIEYISLINFISSEFGFNTLNLLLEEYNKSNDFVTSIENATKLNFSSFEEQWLNAI